LRAPRSILSIVLDPNIRDAYWDRLVFYNRYQNEFLKKSLGGTWKPHFRARLLSPKLLTQALFCTKVLIEYPIVPILEYQRELTNLCYNSGLKCWWAPDLILVNDKTQWFKKPPENIQSQATPDGLLGPMFVRSVGDTLKTSDKKYPWSHETINEWLIFNMSGKETAHDFGSKHSETLEEIKKSWGYKTNREWRQRDFDMLFDRIFLKLPIKEIAKKYPFEDSVGKIILHETSVQRTTQSLAKLLHLPLPKAVHKKQV
jgi:hypothetical protein